ncbi:MAG: ribonuclease HII, partial [Acidimicrobiales bacterium]
KMRSTVTLAAVWSEPMALAVRPVRPPVVRRQVVPSLSTERALWDAGCEVVVGVDEVGRGSWAGPISVGAAVLPRDRRVRKVRDSKMLTEPEREHIFPRLAEWCATWAVGHASQEECDELGMSAAQKLAARRAIEGLGVVPDAVLVDGNWDFVGGARVKRIVKGDASCLSIATASVLAKVTRDRLMRAEAEHFPGYDFELNKGYPCPRHKAALAAWGPTSIHRRAWIFMDHLPWGGVSRFVRDGIQEALW